MVCHTGASQLIDDSHLSGISKAFGPSWSESGIEHFFRPLKKHAVTLRNAVAKDEDTSDYVLSTENKNVVS